MTRAARTVPRALFAVALCLVTDSALAGCKNHQPGGGGAAQGSGAVPPAPALAIDWSACEAAMVTAAVSAPHARAKLVIDGCHVCGDWTPILSWNTPHPSGGPTRKEIEDAMTRCDAYCSGDAKLKFLGTLDDARGRTSRTPWRQLGEICKGKVSAVPDQRFMSAPYLALDRIARIAGDHGGEIAARLATLDLALPALTFVGTGAALPVVDGATPLIAAGAIHVTVLGDLVHVGTLPHAKLSASGVAVDLGPDGYPGVQVPAAELDKALATRIRGAPDPWIALIAPATMPAARLAPIVAAASKVAPVHLAVSAPDSPPGWQIPAAIRTVLEVGGSEPITLAAAMTVQDLAGELAKRAIANVERSGFAVP